MERSNPTNNTPPDSTSTTSSASSSPTTTNSNPSPPNNNHTVANNANPASNKSGSPTSLSMKMPTNNSNNSTNHVHNNLSKKEILIRSARAGSSIDSTSTSSTTSSFRKSYPSCSDINTSFSSASGSMMQDELTNSSMNSMNQCGLTQAGLEEYSRSMYHTMYHHQKQSSYAQSEGYHSYVSSTDSSSTPFLDRLRQDSGLLLSRATNWSSQDIPTSTSSLADNNSSESTSSTETLKWHGSLSDVSVASHATSSSAVSASASQLIVHSARVRTPQRHNSESVLYLNEEQQQLLQQQQQAQVGGSNSSSPTSSASVDDLHSNKSSPDTTPNCRDQRSSRSNSRLFPIHTYTEVPVTTTAATSPASSVATTSPLEHQPQPAAKLLNGHNWQSVAERISELEKQNSSNNVKISQTFKQQQQQQQQQHQKYTFLDPNKIHRVPNPALKQLQKNAVQSYFERQQQQTAKENVAVAANETIRSSMNGTVAANNNKNRPQSLNLNAANGVLKLSVQRSSMSSYGSNSSIDGKAHPQQNPPTYSPPQMVKASSPGHTHNHQHQHPSMHAAPQNGSYGSLKKKSSEKYHPSKQKQADTAEMKPTNKYEPRGYSMNGVAVQQSVPQLGVPPPPPPRNRVSMPLRRTSSAAEYSSIRDKMLQTRQHLSKDLLGPMIMGPIISVDDWVPERPPKNPTLRIPSPELPPPPPAVAMDIGSDDDVMLLNNEPLPPPPPEILHHMHQQSRSGDMSPKPAPIAASSTSRRNSFAGQTTNRKQQQAQQQTQHYRFENKTASPPALPKKPPTAEVSIKRPSSSMAATPTKDSVLHATAQPQHNHTHIVQAHRVMLNGNGNPEVPSKLLQHGGSSHTTTSSNSSNSFNNINNNMISETSVAGHHPVNNMTRIHNAHPHQRMSLRKRSHNSHVPLQELSMKGTLLSPPPLKPRLPIMTDMSNTGIGSKLRSNSKASYLPRQPTRDKLNNDPDRGIYKLTLTSNEDSINVYPDDCLSAKCNLPDVLPVGVKYQNQTRYPATNNNYTTPSPKVAQTAPACISGNAQSKSIFHFPIGGANYTTTGGNNNNNTSHQHPSYSHNHQKTSPTNAPPMYHATGQAQPQYPVYNKPKSNDAVSPKYMSQSTFDLKKTQIIETTPMFTTNEELFKEQHAELRELETPFEYCEMNGLQLLGNGCDEVRDGQTIASDAVVDDAAADEDDDNVQLQVQQQPATVNKSEIAKKLNFEKIESTTFVNNLNNQLNSSSNCNEVNPKHSPCNSDSSCSSSSDSVTSYTASPTHNGPPSPVVMTCTTGSQTATPTDDLTTSATAVISALEIETTVSADTPPDRASPAQCDTDSLKLMQRTELVLRLNAPTAETACQTDDSIEAVVQGLDALSVTCAPPIVFAARQKTQEELDCEKLSQDLVGQLTATDKLYSVLAPKTFKTSADYVSGLYKVQIKSRHTKRVVLSQPIPATSGDPAGGPTSTIAIVEETQNQSNNATVIESLTSNSTYFTISESKAKLMTRYNREMTLINGDCSDLTKKKEELVARLGKKLIVLANEQATVTEESAANDVLGNEVSQKVAQKIKPSDASKFRSYIDDVGYITMLLLSLSSRLARTENALHTHQENDGEKKILEVKRDRLLEQLGEAKQLKDDIDRRGAIIAKILEKYLNAEEFGDYEYFINMKAKLIVDSREIADKIKLGEDQLIALKETIVHSEC